MRIVYMGTPEIAATCLKALVEAGHDIVGVYTKIDTPKNRGMKMTVSAVKAYALGQSLPVYQPTTFKDDAVYEELAALKPELIVAVAYGKILPQRVLDIPEHGCVNIHASILPKLRGAGPIQWSILNGDQETGVTAMYMSAGMDEGDIIEIARTPISLTDTTQSLTERLADMGAELLVKVVGDIAAGTVQRTPQNSAEATYAPMLTKELCPIDFSHSPEEISCQVRGLIPWPVATMTIEDRLLKVFGITIMDAATEKAPGTPVAVTKKGLEMACGGGKVIRIDEVQAQGGKRMRSADYFRGHPITID